MPIKIVVLALVMALAAAFMTTGCSMFGESSSSERLAVAKTVAKTVLKLVVSAYKAGGSELAASQIDSMTADGKLTESQASALKSMLDGGVATLENLANSSDSGAATITTSGETAAASETKD